MFAKGWSRKMHRTHVRHAAFSPLTPTNDEEAEAALVVVENALAFFLSKKVLPPSTFIRPYRNFNIV
jgi:hypothetical protein